jgi:hypothetical protein
MGYVSVVLTDICRSFLRVSKVTEKIKTRSQPTPSENFNSHPLLILKYLLHFVILIRVLVSLQSYNDYHNYYPFKFKAHKQDDTIKRFLSCLEN